MQGVMQASAASAAAAARTCSTSGRRACAAAAAPAPARWQQRQRQSLLVARGVKVELTDLEGKLHVLDIESDETVLDVGLDKGIDMPWDCKMGVCMRCSAKVVSGQVEQPGGMISEECMEQGCALMCVAFPQSDCKISLIEEGELVDAVMNIA